MNSIFKTISFLVIATTINWSAFAANDDGASDIGVDYAYMTMMTLSPDFAAANYTIRNPGEADATIAIARFPYHLDLIKTENNHLELEMAVAHQHTADTFKTFSGPDEKINAEWNTTGLGIGLLYKRKINNYLEFTPSLRYGLTRMESRATYHGMQTKLNKDLFDGTLFNWETNASVLNLGLGIDYHWQILDRDSNINIDYYHHLVESYNESNNAIRFKESADMLTVNADMIFPTDTTIHGRRLDFVLMLGKNIHIGKNRSTLGYSTSNMTGIGAEFPLKLQQSITGYLRLGGQIMWADNMNGWMLTIGYTPK